MKSKNWLIALGVMIALCLVCISILFIGGIIIPVAATPTTTIANISTIIIQTANMASTQTALVIPTTIILTPIPTGAVASTQTLLPTSTSMPAPTLTLTIAPIVFPTQSNCLTAYPDFCIQSNPRLLCADLPKNFTVLSPDPLGYDRDNDGIGCEN